MSTRKIAWQSTHYGACTQTFAGDIVDVNSAVFSPPAIVVIVGDPAAQRRKDRAFARGMIAATVLVVLDGLSPARSSVTYIYI